MADPDYRSYSEKEYPIKDLSILKIAIVHTEWNTSIVQKLTDSCTKELIANGLTKGQIHKFRVPGSYELPMGAKMILGSQLKTDAIICLGCVIQGETKHDDYINHTIARSINNIGLVSGIPVIFGVLTTNSREQAMARADGSHGDKGSESALAALKMISLKEQLAAKSKKISF